MSSLDDLAYTVFVQQPRDGGATSMSLWRGEDHLSEVVRMRLEPHDDLIDAVQRRFQVHVDESHREDDEDGTEWALTVHTDWLPDVHAAVPAEQVRDVVYARLGMHRPALTF